MNKASTPHEQDTAITKPKRAVAIARMAIALALLAGVTVFGILAINDLMDSFDNPPATTLAANDPAQWGPNHPDFYHKPDANPLLPESETHTPIDHDPGRLAAFPGSRKTSGNRVKATNGLITEIGNYRIDSATVLDIIAHYRQVAEQAGFRFLASQPISANGHSLTMVRNGQRLNVTTWPAENTAPPQPPLLPTVPLIVVVELHYPIGQDSGETSTP